MDSLLMNSSKTCNTLHTSCPSTWLSIELKWAERSLNTRKYQLHWASLFLKKKTTTKKTKNKNKCLWRMVNTWSQVRNVKSVCFRKLETPFPVLSFSTCGRLFRTNLKTLEQVIIVVMVSRDRCTSIIDYILTCKSPWVSAMDSSIIEFGQIHCCE